jgi:hypothetical protein
MLNHSLLWGLPAKAISQTTKNPPLTQEAGFALHQLFQFTGST